MSKFRMHPRFHLTEGSDAPPLKRAPRMPYAVFSLDDEVFAAAAVEDDDVAEVAALVPEEEGVAVAASVVFVLL